MRFAALNLERYGAFTGRQLSFAPQARLHLVHGANEAGKTTALSAIGDLLFGFPTRLSHDFVHKGDQLRLGGEIVLATGTTLSFRRRRGRNNTLVDADDKPLPDGVLVPVLGGVSRDDFRAEYGLTAALLRHGGEQLLQTGGRLAEMMAAGSAGMSALSQLAAALEAEASELFTERRVASKPFYVAGEAYRDADTALRAALVTPDAWKDAQAHVAGALLAVEQAEAEQKALSLSLARLERLRAVEPLLRRLGERRAWLAELKELPPADPGDVQRWRDAAGEADRLTLDLARLDGETAEADAVLQTLPEEADLLAAAPMIDPLPGRLIQLGKALDDLPRRLQARDDAQAQLAAIARRLGIANVAVLLAREPEAASLAGARQQVAERKAAENEAQQAKADVVKQQLAVDAVRKADGVRALHLADPAPLRQRLEALSAILLDAAQVRRERPAVAGDELRLIEGLARLNPAVESLDELARLPLPDAATLQRAMRSQAEIERDARRLEEETARLADEHRAAEAELGALAVKGGGVTHADLAAARASRDAAAADLAQTLATGTGEAQVRLEMLRERIWRADDTADALIRLGDLAARRDVALQKMAHAQASMMRHDELVRAFDRRRAEAEREWAKVWEPCALTPADAEKMTRWIDDVGRLLEARHKLGLRREALAATQAGFAERHAALEILARDMRLPVAEHLPPDILHGHVQTAIGELQAAWAQSRSQATEARMLAAGLAEAQARLGRAQAVLADIAGRWPDVLQHLAIATGGVAEAEAALQEWSNAVEPRVLMDRENRSITGIQADEAAFDGAIREIVARVAPDSGGISARQALDVLVQRVAAARAAQETRGRLAVAAKARAEQRTRLAHALAQAQATLGEPRAALADPSELPAAFVGWDQRFKWQAECSEFAMQLREAAGDHTEADLRNDLAGMETDAIPGAVLGLRAGSNAAGQALGEAIAMHREAEKALHRLREGRNAPQFQQAKVEAGEQMLEIGRNWMVRATAARLARAAIERHRALVQDPLIARASHLFQIVTCGGFAGLVTDFDASDNPTLAGARADGGRVAVENMSEGTRDQLFLVLRLALLEQRTGEPLPFIGDDLLASFDEARTGEALDLLAEFGAGRQVILFTHHRHVVDIARRRLGGQVDVVDL